MAKPKEVTEGYTYPGAGSVYLSWGATGYDNFYIPKDQAMPVHYWKKAMYIKMLNLRVHDLRTAPNGKTIFAGQKNCKEKAITTIVARLTITTT